MIYSEPIKKEKAIEMFINCFSGFTQEQKVSTIKFMSNSMTDLQFMKDFNKTMNLRLRLFAPGMFQIVYDN